MAKVDFGSKCIPKSLARLFLSISTIAISGADEDLLLRAKTI